MSESTEYMTYFTNRLTHYKLEQIARKSDIERLREKLAELEREYYLYEVQIAEDTQALKDM